MRYCVPSCKDLRPAAYIYENDDNKKKCVRNCSLTEDKTFVD